MLESAGIVEGRGAPARLEYAPGVSARRRWARRVVRWGMWVVLLGAVGLGLKYGPGIWRHWELLRVQQRCMEAELPTDRPMVEWGERAAPKLLLERSAEYRASHWKSAVRVDGRWEDLRGRLGIVPWSAPKGVLFLHERFTPKGERRLVVVEGDVRMMVGVSFSVTVVRPAGVIRRAVVTNGSAQWEGDPPMELVEVMEPGYGVDARFGSGVIDPVDRSRFSIPLMTREVTTMLEFRLRDDDTVSVRAVEMIDPKWNVPRAPGPVRDPLLGRPEVR